MKKTKIIYLRALISTCFFFTTNISQAQCHGGDNESASEKKQVKQDPAGTNIFYTCPMHTNVKLELPGKCPVCSMKLEAFKDSKASYEKAQKTIYYSCSLHPVSKFDKKGTCPICNRKFKKYKSFVYI